MCLHRVFSAPGKALLAGGYLVLDPAYQAFVVALSARMHARIEGVEEIEGGSTTITVNSPQFKEGTWSYNVDLADIPSLTETHGRTNPFVKSTILTILSYIQPTQNYHVALTIYSDTGYHTQTNSHSKTSQNGKRTFLFHDAAITAVPKTGLGSSAGLVTSLTAALLCIYRPFAHFDVHMLHTVHNLAQVAHCMAQGKVGSGFDVAAAVYGSIVYRRFSPDLVNGVLTLPNAEFAQGLRTLVDNTDWKTVHRPCCLVPGIHILMGDVAGGSETPKLVGKVTAWRKAQPQRALEVWTRLNAANMELVDALNRLERVHGEDQAAYSALLSTLQTHSANQISAQGPAALQQVVDAVAAIRSGLKTMTQESGAEIEPEAQTALLDSCSGLAGCLGGVVPGAGGYDAVCLLVAEQSIAEIVRKTAADPQFSHVSWLQLEEQRLGLEEETWEDFEI